MNRMWSPWRSNYIDSFKNKKETSNCVFCDAVDADISSDECIKVYDGETCFVMLNLYPYNNGHVMVIPKRHISNMLELTEPEMTEMMSLVRKSLKALEKILAPHGFNFGANLGKAAGAGIDTHLHFHIVPRWNGDTNFMPALGEVKVISQDLLITKKNLIEALKGI
ncbi:MAG: hydrolase [Melioribacteraceae bacterium]|nr:MAG: hydrolase [Melioribacteraceae bacterium]